MRAIYYIALLAFLLIVLSPSEAKKKKSKSKEKQKEKAPESLLFAARDDVLPRNIFKNLLEECTRVGRWSGEEDSFMHGKKPTFWLDLTDDAPPRNYIEKALLMLRKEVVPRMFAHRKEQTIVGGEWWTQVRNGDETIDFHYDKDEAMASIQGVMKLPLVSTVTYLTDIGAPTLILNQTTIDGNAEVPEVPEEGYLSYPKKNRHIMFSGDLQHGVLGSAAPTEGAGVSSGRVTLLINWWDVAPLEPNTRTLSDELASKMGIDSLMDEDEDDEDDEDEDEDEDYMAQEMVEVDVLGTGDTLLKPTPGKHGVAAQGQEANLLNIPVLKSENTRHKVMLPPGDMFFMHLPKGLDSGLHRIKWRWNETYGSVGQLDLQKSTQVGQLFRLPYPKAMVIYHTKKDKKVYKKALNAVLPIAKKYLGAVKFYFCPSDKTADMMNAFGLTEDDLPRLVVHDTASDEKYVQPAEEFSTKQDKIEDFLKMHIDLEGKEYLHK